MTTHSKVQRRGRVSFPEFTGERVYMREFRQADGLPADLSRWQPTVDSMLDGIELDGPLYLMVDQAHVRAGTPHRRGGVHVDGYWQPAVHAHGGGGGHTGGGGGWRIDEGGHRGSRSGHVTEAPPGGHRGGSHAGSSGVAQEALLLASNMLGCRAYVGAYAQRPGSGGDCSHIDVSRMDRIDLEPGHVWAGHTLGMLHESIPLPTDSLRTVVRLNVPGWIPS